MFGNARFGGNPPALGFKSCNLQALNHRQKTSLAQFKGRFKFR